MTLHKEVNFESEICGHLAGNGWLHVEGDAARYDRARALFPNGLPVATAELKTDFTQSVGDAIDQYRFDRHPRPKGQAAEPLLSFPSGALVHFAVSNREVHMTTRLDGTNSEFLPFNQGDHG